MIRVSRSKQKKQLKELFSKIIRMVNQCERCGSTKGLQCSHVKSVGSHPRLQFDLNNAICLCYACHIHWWHKEPTEASDWFKQKYPKQLAYLEEQIRNESTLPEQDYGQLIEQFKGIIKS